MKQSTKTLYIIFLSTAVLIILILINARLSLDLTELSKHERQSQTLDVTNYQHVEISGAMKVNISRGEQWQSKITHHSPTIFEHIDVYVDNNTLYIKEKDDIPAWFHDYKVKIRLVMPSLSKIKASGSSDVRIENFTGNKLAIRTSGSVDLVAKNSQYTNVLAKASGSSDLKLRKMTATNLKASLSGSSELKIRVDGGELIAKLKGSSELDYYGTTSKTQFKISDHSEVKRRGR